MQLAVFDAETSSIHRYVSGQFVAYQPETDELPTSETSIQWYWGKREHLGFASIIPTGNLPLEAIMNQVEPS